MGVGVYHPAMSKVTFRADEELVERIEALDASKSEVMRQALRAYLDREAPAESTPESATVDDALAARVDDLIEERLDAHLGPCRALTRGEPAAAARDLNVNVTVEGREVRSSDAVAESTPEPGAEASRKTRADETADDPACNQCGETFGDDHVYCPNCGEKRSHRVFCECGDEVRSDWAFCPSCGRRTPAADVLDRS